METGNYCIRRIRRGLGTYFLIEQKHRPTSQLAICAASRRHVTLKLTVYSVCCDAEPPCSKSGYGLQTTNNWESASDYWMSFTLPLTKITFISLYE